MDAVNEMISRDKIQKFLKDIDPKIMARGTNYYDEGRVECTDREEGYIAAQVYGGDIEPYLVELYFAKDGELQDWACDCPYDQGDVCKHVAAVLLSVLDEPEEKTRKAPRKTEIQELVEQAEQEQLAALILEHCRMDKRFQSQVISALESSGELELQSIRELIKNTIRANRRQGYIDMEGCDSICDDLNDVLKKAWHRAEQGRYDLALELSQFVLLTGMGLSREADSSSGSLSVTLDDTMDMLGHAAAGLAESGGDRTEWVEKLLDTAQDPVFDGWEGWRYDLLQQAAVLADEQNEDKFYAVLNRISDHQWEEFRDDSWYTARDKQVRYQIISAAHGPQGARGYLEQNLDVDDFRRILVQEEIQAGNYANAERLCRERTQAEEPRPWLRPSQWQYFLYTIYQDWGQREKQIEQARTLAVSGDKKFCQTLKELLTADGRWQEERLQFFAAFQAARPPYEYMDLLEREQETALLMEQVRLQPAMAFRYGGALVPAYGEEFCGICAVGIREHAKAAGNRREYRVVCDLIGALAKWGEQAEAKRLIQELRQTYPRRTALRDELQRLERKLKT